MSGYELQKTRGEHFLTNTAVIENIVRLAELRASDTVLEIGPGSGNLTVHLLPVAKHVIAIEVDERMVSELKKRIAPEFRSKLTIIHGDFCKMKEIPPFDCCVSNCPYNISSEIIFKLLSLAHASQRIRKLVLMFQLEFCQSLAAEPGEKAYTRLSVNTRLLTKSVRIILKVGPENFTPPPRVDSAVIEIIPQSNTGLGMQEFEQFEGMTRKCFGLTRKQLAAIFKIKFILNDLCQNYQLRTKTAIAPADMEQLCLEALAENGLQEKRPDEVSVDGYLQLLASFTKRGVIFS